MSAPKTYCLVTVSLYGIHEKCSPAPVCAFVLRLRLSVLFFTSLIFWELYSVEGPYPALQLWAEKSHRLLIKCSHCAFTDRSGRKNAFFRKKRFSEGFLMRFFFWTGPRDAVPCSRIQWKRLEHEMSRERISLIFFGSFSPRRTPGTKTTNISDGCAV